MGNARSAAVILAGAVILVSVLTALIAWSVEESKSPAALSLVVEAGFATLFGMVALVAVGYCLVGLENKNEALGLPSGSVRALIALFIIVMFVVSAFYFAEVLRTQRAADAKTPKDRPVAILSLLGNSAFAQPAATTGPTGPTTSAPQGPSGTTGATGPTGGQGEKLDTVNDLAKQVLQILGTLMTTIVGFYFGSKSATEATTKVGDAIQKSMTGRQS